jgi:hypothetical protein
VLTLETMIMRSPLMVTVVSTMNMEMYDNVVITVMDPAMLKVLMLVMMVMANLSMVVTVVSTTTMEMVMTVMDPTMLKVLMLMTMVMANLSMVTVVSTMNMEIHIIMVMAVMDPPNGVSADA